MVHILRLHRGRDEKHSKGLALLPLLGILSKVCIAGIWCQNEHLKDMTESKKFSVRGL